MASIGLTFAWLREEIDAVEHQHRKTPCPRCKTRGFRWIRWFPCRLCAGHGYARVDLRESSHRLRGYVDLLEERVKALEAELGWKDRMSRW